MTKTSRGARAVKWIERYCIVPSGPDRGQHVRLSEIQRETVRRIYDERGKEAVSGPLAAFLTLLHICGPEALLGKGAVPYESDLFTVWNASGPDLKEVLRRDRDQIVCPELGTRWPTAA